MSKCPICGLEYKNGRGLHAHMLKAHKEDYKKHGNSVKNYQVDDEKPKKEKYPRPDDLRLLNQEDHRENLAYAEGYRYIAKGLCYTAEEVKERGWI